MSHHYIVPQYTNNTSMPGFSFHHLPLHNENVLTNGWLISKQLTLQLMNIHVSAVNISKEEKSEDNDDISMIFAWSETTKNLGLLVKNMIIQLLHHLHITAWSNGKTSSRESC